MKKIHQIISVCLLLLTSNCFAQTRVPAFPGAEGGGAYTTGGRGGNVYFVTSLEDANAGNPATGEGTLRWCLAQAGPRTIVFRVSGIIRLKSILKIPTNTSIAGQTAPGDGICIADYTVQLGGNNIIVRYMRFRMGDVTATENDAFNGRNCSDIIIDHCSMSWSTDECASFYDNTNFTLQWSILSESLRNSVHEKGKHGYGGIWGGKTASFHHNLLAHHDSRNPRMCGSRYSNKPELELVDFRNNVIYNWGANSGYAGEGGRYNFVNNYYKPGPESSNKTRIFQPYPDDGTNAQPAGIWGTFYVNGNYVDGSSAVTTDNWQGIHPNGSSKKKDEIKSLSEFEVPYVSTHSAIKAYEYVLDKVGASLSRDSTDARIINEVTNKLAPVRGSNGTTLGGLIDSQSDVGGWETYTFTEDEVPTDADRDGMGDEWELENGLNPNDKEDRNLVADNGYTMLELYINRLLAGIYPLSKNTINIDPQWVVYPNPANGLAHLKFNLDQEDYLQAELISISGEKVKTIVSNHYAIGNHTISFDVTQLQQGCYFCKIFTASGNNQLIKFLVKNSK
jgi:hypothetical protein